MPATMPMKVLRCVLAEFDVKAQRGYASDHDRALVELRSTARSSR
jgi:hypothetical protein